MKQALRDALDERGYDQLTPVQEAVMADDLQGRDLLVSAQTGSGKTLGFGLAIAPTLMGEAEDLGLAAAPLGLVVAPTRELALQVKRELSWLFAKAGAQMASCVGGMDMRDERRALSRGAHIVVATPGRLRDHIMRGSIDLSGVRAVVLDEADEMLDLGFREDLEFILSEAPTERQTLLFSATVPASIARLAKSYQRDAERVVTKSATAQHADITYHALNVAERDVENAVINTLLFHRAPNAIVFANTRATVNRLTTRLSNRGFQVVALSGELSQAERTHALQAMRDGRAQVCVATDVAARGIDLPNLDLVVHAELPGSHETLLHRSGRTGRAGRKGVSALIVTKKNRRKAERILGMAKLRAEWGPAASADAVNAREEERMFGDASWNEAVAESEAETVGRLHETFSPEQLAVAFLRLYRSVRSAPEELGDAEAKSEPRPAFGPSVWFSISGGHDAGAEPRRILPVICKVGGLTKDDIGAIRVRQDMSYVEVLETSAAGVLATAGETMTLEQDAVLTRLAEAPEMGPRPGGGKPRGEFKGKPRRDDGDRPAWKDKPRRDDGDKPAWKDKHKDGGKPAWKDKHQDGEKPVWKDKPRHKDGDKPAWKDKPERSERSDKPRAKSTPPVDYNDAPNSKPKRPKPEDRKGGDKPWKKPGGKPAGKPGAKPGVRAGASDPGRSMRRPSDDSGAVHERKAGGRKGPPPPAGKASSKKNKARADKNKGAPRRSGDARPTRPKG